MDVVTLPGRVREMFDGSPLIGTVEQAFVFATVDSTGFPHFALLSRHDIVLGNDDAVLHVVLSVGTSSANLLRDERAAVLLVDGDQVHHLKLKLQRSLVDRDAVGAVLVLTDHRATSRGIRLSPLQFVPDETFKTRDGWDRTNDVMDRLRGAAPGEPHHRDAGMTR
ncbi:MAG: hypothetical protein AB7Q27_01605 [Acidimicrobiia bacterium]